MSYESLFINREAAYNLINAKAIAEEKEEDIIPHEKITDAVISQCFSSVSSQLLERGLIVQSHAMTHDGVSIVFSALLLPLPPQAANEEESRIVKV